MSAQVACWQCCLGVLLCTTPLVAHAQGQPGTSPSPPIEAASPGQKPAEAEPATPPGSGSASESGSESGSASASESESESESESGSESESASESGSASESEPESEPASEFEDELLTGVDDAEVSASSTALAQRRRSELEAALQRVEREREDSSLLLPWLVLGTGLAMSAVGLGVGISDVLCDGSCTGPFWGSWLVVAGATAGSAGALWLAREHHDLAELQRRHDTLERELEYLQWSAVPSLRHAF